VAICSNEQGRPSGFSQRMEIKKDKNIITDPINILHPNTVKTSPNEHACLLAHIYPCKKKHQSKGYRKREKSGKKRLNQTCLENGGMNERRIRTNLF